MTPSVCASLSLKVGAAESGAAGAYARSGWSLACRASLPDPGRMLSDRAIAARARCMVRGRGAFCAAPGRLALSIAMTATAFEIPSRIV